MTALRDRAAALGMSACGTTRTFRNVCYSVAIRVKTDMGFGRSVLRAAFVICPSAGEA